MQSIRKRKRTDAGEGDASGCLRKPDAGKKGMDGQTGHGRGVNYQGGLVGNHAGGAGGKHQSRSGRVRLRRRAIHQKLSINRTNAQGIGAAPDP